MRKDKGRNALMEASLGGCVAIVRFILDQTVLDDSNNPHEALLDADESTASVTVWGLSCSFCCRNSPLLTRYCLSCTGVVYGHSPIYTVCRLTQYNLSSILQYFLHTITLIASNLAKITLRSEQERRDRSRSEGFTYRIRDEEDPDSSGEYEGAPKRTAARGRYISHHSIRAIP
jgi:hypothetical protein